MSCLLDAPPAVASPSSRARPSLPSRSPHPGSDGRLHHIDVLRGAMLVLMAVNHVPNDLHVATDHIFGFVSAAEGFVFLSGLMAGFVYTKHYLRNGFAAARDACLQRTRTVYGSHLLAYFLIFAGVVAYALWRGAFPVNAPAQMVERPLTALLTGPLLVYQPSLLDILPLYCVLLLALPYLIKSYASGHRGFVLFASFQVWAATNYFAPQTPFTNAFVDTGAFNLAAWQFLFVAGSVFGHAWAGNRVTAALVRKTPESILPPPNAAALALLAGVAALLYCIRHAYLPSGLPPSLLDWLTNKNNLAPLRLFNAAVLFYLVYAVCTRFPGLIRSRPLAVLGRNSIAVFTTHVLVAYVLLAFPEVFVESANGRWLGTGLMLFAMFIAAGIRPLLTLMKSAPPVARSQARPRPPRTALHPRQSRSRRLIVFHEQRPLGPADPVHR